MDWPLIMVLIILAFPAVLLAGLGTGKSMAALTVLVIVLLLGAALTALLLWVIED